MTEKDLNEKITFSWKSWKGGIENFEKLIKYFYLEGVKDGRDQTFEKKRINVAEILQHAPEAIELYSPLYGKCRLFWVKKDLEQSVTIAVRQMQGEHPTVYFDNYGVPSSYKNAETLLYPSKNHQTWEGWQNYLLGEGDVIIFDNSTFLIVDKSLTVLRSSDGSQHRVEPGDVFSFKYADRQHRERFLSKLVLASAPKCESSEERVVDILKEVPWGTQLYSPAYGWVKFERVDESNFYPIQVRARNTASGNVYFTEDGRLSEDGEVQLFPSYDLRCWNAEALEALGSFRIEKERYYTCIRDFYMLDAAAVQLLGEESRVKGLGKKVFEKGCVYKGEEIGNKRPEVKVAYFRPWSIVDVKPGQLLSTVPGTCTILVDSVNIEENTVRTKTIWRQGSPLNTIHTCLRFEELRPTTLCELQEIKKGKL